MPVVLVLAASPDDQSHLSLGREIKKIKHSLQRSNNREQWRIESIEAVTVEDLRRALLDHNPTILHFSGHGGGEVGLCFEDEQGMTHLTHGGPLTKLFHNFKDTLKCVVLNACHSDSQAEAIVQQIDYVIGMNASIGDDAAQKFSVAFYDGIFAGVDFRKSFDIACAAIDLSNFSEGDVPVFRVSPQLGGTQFDYTEDVPEIENVLLAYFNAVASERYQFTTKGAEIADQMNRFYGDEVFTRATNVTVITKRRLDDVHWKVNVKIGTVAGKVYRNLFLRIVDRSVKVEWEATVGYWSMPYRTFLAFGSDEVVTARVFASLGNSYYGEFRNLIGQVQAVDLRTIGRNTLYGYVSKRESHYEQLMALLKDGRTHEVTLGIRNVDNDADYVLILSLISSTWIVP